MRTLLTAVLLAALWSPALAATDREEIMSFNAVVYTDVTNHGQFVSCDAAGHIYTESQVEHPDFSGPSELRRRLVSWDECRHALGANHSTRFQQAYAVANRAYSFVCAAARRSSLPVHDCPPAPLMPAERAGDPEPGPHDRVVYYTVTPPPEKAAPTPAPLPTAAPVLDTKCDHAARAVSLVRPAYPAAAANAGEAGTTIVRVSLDRAGAVTGAKVYHGSGFADLDALAVHAARISRYGAQMAGCRPVPSTYLYVADAAPRPHSAPMRTSNRPAPAGPSE